MGLEYAINEVANNRICRMCKPGHWVVWREGCDLVSSDYSAMRFDENGVVAFNATYTSPLQTTNGYLWTSASGVLRISAINPTTDGDGVAVGLQS